MGKYIKILQELFRTFRDGGSVYASYDDMDAIDAAICIMDGHDEFISRYKQIESELAQAKDEIERLKMQLYK